MAEKEDADTGGKRSHAYEDNAGLDRTSANSCSERIPHDTPTRQALASHTDKSAPTASPDRARAQ